MSNKKTVQRKHGATSWNSEEARGDQFERKNVALGNLGGDIDFISAKNSRLLGAQDVRGGDFSRFNENPRMMAIGYELKGDVGQEVLYKNGAPVDMGDYLYNNAGPGENWDTLPNQFQNNNPKAPGYYKMDDSLLLGYIHKNLEEEDLEKLENKSERQNARCRTMQCRGSSETCLGKT